MNDSTTIQKLQLIFDGKRQPDPQDRAWALALVGINQRDIARKLGVSFVAVHNTLYDKSRCYDIATHIAAATGLSLNRLWPCGKYAESPAQRRARVQTPRHAA